MYKIIGADNNVYGPVTVAQLRQWVNEGRANGQTRVQPEGSTAWQTLASIPEFADLAGGSPPGFAALTPGAATAGIGGVPTMEELLARDYDLDIGGCVSRAWELLKHHFWPVVGITLLVFVLTNGISQALNLFCQPQMNAILRDRTISPTGALWIGLISLLSLMVNTVLLGGLYKYYLMLIRGERPGIADAFYGVTHAFVPLALLGLVMGPLLVLGFAACILPGIYLSIAWYFAAALIVDRGLGFWEAMELSRKVVTKHWFIVLGLVLVIGLLGGAGIFVCFIGIFVTLPLSLLALMYGYETIFGARAPSAS